MSRYWFLTFTVQIYTTSILKCKFNMTIQHGWMFPVHTNWIIYHPLLPLIRILCSILSTKFQIPGSGLEFRRFLKHHYLVLGARHKKSQSKDVCNMFTAQITITESSVFSYAPLSQTQVKIIWGWNKFWNRFAWFIFRILQLSRMWSSMMRSAWSLSDAVQVCGVCRVADNMTLI